MSFLADTLLDAETGSRVGVVAVLFAASLAVVFIGSLLWRKAPSRGGRLVGALALGPAAAGFSGLLFHAGWLLAWALSPVVGLEPPTPDSGLGTWLWFCFLAALLPFIVSAALVVILAVVFDLGPEVVVSHFLSGDEADTFLTGSSCSDALSCVTLGVILFGPLPYGLLFGSFGFVFGGLARLVGVEAPFMPDTLALLVIAGLVWAGSLPGALRAR